MILSNKLLFSFTPNSSMNDMEYSCPLALASLIRGIRSFSCCILAAACSLLIAVSCIFFISEGFNVNTES